MNTSILTVVLAGSLLAGQNGSPTWQNSYSHGLKLGAEQKKPLVVVIGSGANGWTKVIRDGAPSPEVTQLLSQQYVCVYVDSASPQGKTLAQSFEISGTGLVISDMAGQYQAFWHRGDLSDQALAHQLVKHGDPAAVVVQTTSIVPTQPAPQPQAKGAEAPKPVAAVPTLGSAGGALPSSRTPNWQSSYSQAQLLGTAQKKPLAIVFGSGPKGWDKVAREANLRGDVNQVLTDRYVCVYVDTASTTGQTLAHNFDISGKVGLVISDRDGASQAFWHQGDLTSDSMAHYLQKYADPAAPVRNTETVNTSRTSYYPQTQARPAFTSGSC